MSGVAPVAAAAPGEPPARLAEAAQGFEALFVAQVLKAARAAALADDGFGDGAAPFRDLQDELRAAALVKAAPLGVLRDLERR